MSFKLTTEDVFFAYRKAKSDAFHSKSETLALAFARYEHQLVKNLRQLTGTWDRERAGALVKKGVGGVELISKCLRDDRPVGDRSSAPPKMILMTDENQDAPPDSIAEFRTFGEFSVEIHILGAHWINTVGDKLDAELSKSCYGNRLRRLKNKNYHLHHTGGSFQMFHTQWERWRNDGKKAIERLLDAEKPAYVITSDMKSFYPKIDAGFVLDPTFQAEFGVTFNHEELALTKLIVEIVHRWNKRNGSIFPLGLPLNFTPSRVLSNIILAPLDKAMEESCVAHYGRYVDDLFIVLNCLEVPVDGSEPKFWQEIGGKWLTNSEVTSADFPWLGDTTIHLAKNKTRVMELKGATGRAVLEGLDNELNEIASERNKLPPRDPSDTASRQALRAQGPNGSTIHLREADQLTITKFAWSIESGRMEKLNSMLQSQDWEKNRKKFYEFTQQFVLTPKKILETFDKFLRVLKVSINCGDFSEAELLVQKVCDCFFGPKDVRKVGLIGVRKVVNGLEFKGVAEVDIQHFERRMGIAILSAVADESKLEKLLQFSALKKVVDVTSSNPKSDWEALLLSDFGFKSYLEIRQELPRPKQPKEDAVCGIADITWPVEFCNDSKLPFWFPTRPLKARDLLLVANTDPKHVCELVNYFRGTWTKPKPFLLETNLKGDESKEAKLSDNPRIAVTNFLVPYDYWLKNAGGEETSGLRYDQVSQIVELARACKPKPDYLVMPELSLSKRLFQHFGESLQDSGINLIAGIEYEVDSDKKTVVSCAGLYVRENCVDYDFGREFYQHKRLPAPEEEADLLRLFGLNWKTELERPNLIRHEGFCFAVLVCSELQDIHNRAKFRGKVDGLFVLSWNKDVGTFNTLVESAALDVHSAIILVNNREYGDSRIRIPAKKPHERDICRIQGGENDFVVVATLPVQEMRAFQSRIKRWPDPKDQYKPLPEGYDMAQCRRTIPK